MQSEIFESIKERFGGKVAPSSRNLVSRVSCVQKVENLIKIVKPKRILEIGTFQGISAAYFAQFAEVITVDISFQIMAKKIWKFRNVFDRVDYFVIPAKKTIKKFIAMLDFDCAVIDADHTWKGVSNDYEMTKKCGNVIFHDYGWELLDEENENYPDVTRFVDTLPGDEVLKTPPFALWRAKK